MRVITFPNVIRNGYRIAAMKDHNKQNIELLENQKRALFRNAFARIHKQMGYLFHSITIIIVPTFTPKSLNWHYTLFYWIAGGKHGHEDTYTSMLILTPIFLILLDFKPSLILSRA